MPNPAWESDYNYTPYRQSLHQNALRPGWSTTAVNAVPYHRSHPYGYAYPYQNYGPTAMYPVLPAAHAEKMIAPPQGKRKYSSELNRPKITTLNLRFETSSEKAYLIWDAYPGRKDIYYKVEAMCTSSACNFEPSGEGRRWSFEQTWTQTSKLLTTTPGNVYSITVEVRDLTTKNLVYQEENKFKACISLAEHEMLYWKAAKFATKNMHPFQFLYRCKPKIYWDYIHRQNYDLMEKYVKDNNGQPSNQINGNICGLFFSARLQPDGTLPTSSPFGDVRMLVHGHVLLDPEKHNFYFADFYCNYLTHYVTVVVCVKGSETDEFCQERCFSINIFDNPFIKIVRAWNNFEKRYHDAYFVCRDIWVEIYYTENVHLNWGRFSDIIATGAGTSKIGGLPNNKQCTVCNLYRVMPSEKLEGMPDDPLDMTFLDDQLLQSSTFRKICELDKQGLEDDWDDLVEVICSIVDGACELQIEEQPVEEKSSDPIVQGNREISQLIMDTEAELGSSILLKAIPKLNEAFLAVKKHADDFKEKLAKLQALNEQRKTLPNNVATIGQDICNPQEGSSRASESIEDVSTWCREEGMLFDGIDVRSAGENAGYGVFATRNFRPEEKLIVIPDEFMLTGGKVADMEGYSDIADRADPPFTPFEMLTVFFAMENPENSEWGPYLKILPESFDTPSYLSIDFVPEDLPLSSREHWRKHQAELEQNLTKIEALLPQIPRQKLLWAWHVVYTRCVYNENRHHPKLDNSDDDTLIVAPLIDMLNHDNVSQCVFLTDKVKRNYLVKANRTVMEGDQALVTYGGHTNARLWFCYGFRLPENVNNKVEVPYYLLFELALQIGLDIHEENENAIYEINFPNTIYASDESLSWQFLTNVKILLMSKEGAIQYRTHVLNNIDYDKEPELPLRIRVHETSIRFLEALIGNMTADKSNAPQAVHWIWDEDIGLLIKTLAKTREELAELEVAQNESSAQNDDEN